MESKNELLGEDRSLFDRLLSFRAEKSISDLCFVAGQEICVRADGVLAATGIVVTDHHLTRLLGAMMSEAEAAAYARGADVDFSWCYAGRRFRGNAYHAGGAALSLRLLPKEIPALADISPLKVWERLLALESGLILVCGRTGAGKSTTIAAFLAERLRRSPAHLLTLEDPVEYLFATSGGLVSQRELGRDFGDYAAGLRSALREMPDLLLIGEIRDAASLRAALAAAESGMLVVSTLHTMGAREAVLRMEGLFPASELDGLRTRLSSSLAAVLSQRLIPRAGGGRVALTEVFTRTPAAANLIRTGHTEQLPSVMMAGARYGMVTPDAAIARLLETGAITRETARAEREKASLFPLGGGDGLDA